MGQWDNGTMGRRGRHINLARSAPYFSVFTFHLSLYKHASQTPYLSVFTFHLSLKKIPRVARLAPRVGINTL